MNRPAREMPGTKATRHPHPDGRIPPVAAFECPHCRATVGVDVTAAPPETARCRACHAFFSLPNDAPDAGTRSTRLNVHRVHMLSTRRRSILRTRTYAILAAATLAAIAVGCAWKAATGLRAVHTL